MRSDTSRKLETVAGCGATAAGSMVVVWCLLQCILSVVLSVIDLCQCLLNG